MKVLVKEILEYNYSFLTVNEHVIPLFQAMRSVLFEFLARPDENNGPSAHWP